MKLSSYNRYINYHEKERSTSSSSGLHEPRILYSRSFFSFLKLLTSIAFLVFALSFAFSLHERFSIFNPAVKKIVIIGADTAALNKKILSAIVGSNIEDIKEIKGIGLRDGASKRIVDKRAIYGLSEKSNIKLLDFANDNLLKRIYSRIIKENNLQYLKLYISTPDTIVVHFAKQDPFAIYHNGREEVVIDLYGNTIEHASVDAINGAHSIAGTSIIRLYGDGALSKMSEVHAILNIVRKSLPKQKLRNIERIERRRWNLEFESGLIIQAPELSYGDALKVFAKIFHDCMENNLQPLSEGNAKINGDCMNIIADLRVYPERLFIRQRY